MMARRDASQVVISGRENHGWNLEVDGGPVSDVDRANTFHTEHAARAELVERGVEVSEIQVFPCRSKATRYARLSGQVT